MARTRKTEESRRVNGTRSIASRISIKAAAAAAAAPTANQKRVNVYFFAFYLFFGNMENDLLIRFRHNISTHTSEDAHTATKWDDDDDELNTAANSSTFVTWYALMNSEQWKQWHQAQYTLTHTLCDDMEHVYWMLCIFRVCTVQDH